MPRSLFHFIPLLHVLFRAAHLSLLCAHLARLSFYALRRVFPAADCFGQHRCLKRISITSRIVSSSTLFHSPSAAYAVTHKRVSKSKFVLCRNQPRSAVGKRVGRRRSGSKQSPAHCGSPLCAVSSLSPSASTS